MRYHLTPMRMATIKMTTTTTENNKCWWACGEIGILVHWWWECKMVQPLWKIVWQFLKKLNIELPYDPVYTQNKWTSISKRYLYIHVHRSIICNSQKMKVTQVSTDGWMVKENVVYTYNELLFNLKKEGNSGASLVAQWLRIRLPMQGTWVRALVREDPICRRATKPVRHN